MPRGVDSAIFQGYQRYSFQKLSSVHVSLTQRGRTSIDMVAHVHLSFSYCALTLPLS